MSPTRVFVSYIQQNRDTVSRLVAELRNRDLDVWFDRDALTPGVFWRDEVRRAIHEHERFVACFSVEYSERVRTYMNEELALALEEIRLRGTSLWFVPVLLSGEIPDLAIGPNRTLRDIQYLRLDMTAWDESIDKLARALKNVGGPQPAALPESTPEPSRISGSPPKLRAFKPTEVIARRYRIVERVGEGAWSVAYMAFDEITRTRVLLKQLRYHGKDDLKAIAVELRLSQLVRHPNVGTQFELINDEQGVFVIGEYISGLSLDRLLRQAGRVEPALAIRYAEQLSAGVAALHAQGIIHRDIKPSNVMVGPGDQLRIVDLGVAMLAESQPRDAIIGTPFYMAPELFSGRFNSVAADIYSLGLVFFELFTGQQLLTINSPSFSEMSALVRAHRAARGVKPSSLVPGLIPEIDQAIQACLDEDPMKRPAASDLVFLWSTMQTKPKKSRLRSRRGPTLV